MTREKNDVVNQMNNKIQNSNTEVLLMMKKHKEKVNQLKQELIEKLSQQANTEAKKLL